MAITIDPTSQIYEMAEIKIDGEVIYCNEFNVDVGEDGGDPKAVTNSPDPVRYSRTMNNFEWGTSTVEPEFYDFLMEAKLQKKLFTITVYNFGLDGKYKTVGSLLNAKVSSVNYSYGDDGVTIDVEGAALAFELAKE